MKIMGETFKAIAVFSFFFQTIFPIRTCVCCFIFMNQPIKTYQQQQPTSNGKKKTKQKQVDIPLSFSGIANDNPFIWFTITLSVAFQ